MSYLFFFTFQAFFGGAGGGPGMQGASFHFGGPGGHGHSHGGGGMPGGGQFFQFG